MAMLPPNMDQMLETLRAEVDRAIKEKDRTDPEFRRRINKLFSLSIDLDHTVSEIIQMVMQHAERPQNAVALIPQIMQTVKSINVAKERYQEAKKFPHLVHCSPVTLRRIYEKLKELLNEQIWNLFAITRLSTKVEPSLWSAIANSDQDPFGLGGGSGGGKPI